MSKTHEEIRDRAYGLWIDAGSPEGRDEEFWHQAEAELADNGDVDTSEEQLNTELLPLAAMVTPH